MSFPRQAEVELPLLKVLEDLGGEAKPRDIYPLVAKHFPSLTADEQEERLENFPSTRKWNNLVQWVRQRLVEVGQIDGSERGVWRLTASGLERLHGPSSSKGASATSEDTGANTVNLRDLVNASAEEIKARLVAELQALTPRTFEQFCREFLAQLGYRERTGYAPQPRWRDRRSR